MYYNSGASYAAMTRLSIPGTYGGVLYAGNGAPAYTAAGPSGAPLIGLGNNSAPVFGSVSLSGTVVTGVLPVINGGTGASTLTSNGVVYGNGVSPVAVTAASAAVGAILTTDTSGGVPSFKNTLLGAYIIGNSLNATSTTAAAVVIQGGLGVTGNAWVAGTLQVASNANITGGLGVTGATTFGSTVGITGVATVSTVNASGNLNVTGGLGVTGATTLGSTLGVTGAATLSSTLAVTGAANLANNLNVTGGLGVTGAATFGSTTLHSGTATFSSTSTFSGVATHNAALLVTTGGIGVTGAPGKDFASGDFIFIGQVNGVGGAATPARAVVLQTDSAGAILALAVEGSGQNFDVAKVLEYTTSGDGKASDNTTSGAAFDAMFRSFFTIVRVDMTDCGLGYAAKPIVTISTTGGTVSGVPQVCNAVTQRSGSGALFQLTSFNATTTPITFSVKLLDRGIDYVEGDILEFLGPVLSTPGYERSRGVLALVDTVVKGNVLGVELVGPGTKQGTLYKPGAYTFTLPTGNLNNPTTAAYDLRFRVLTVGDPSSISELDIVQSNGDYEVGNQFSHKKLATVTVEEVDSFGKIVSLSYEPGYGYRGFPVVKPKPESSGLAALFNVPYMGVSRIENAYYNNTINVANVVISSPISLLPATAYATIPGDLHPISVDLFKNPNILDTL